MSSFTKLWKGDIYNIFNYQIVFNSLNRLVSGQDHLCTMSWRNELELQKDEICTNERLCEHTRLHFTKILLHHMTYLRSICLLLISTNREHTLFKTNAILNFQDIMESKHFMTTPFNSLSNTSLCVKNDDKKMHCFDQSTNNFCRFVFLLNIKIAALCPFL